MKQRRIAAYLRVSTDEQAAVIDGSLDNQKYRIQAFVDGRNISEPEWGKIVEFYIDDGFSAKDTRRPAFQRMMNDLKKGKHNLILVSDFSRLSRSLSDFCQIQDDLKEFGGLILSLKEQYDPTTPAGRMMLNLTINLAQFEREQTGERVALGCHARAMRGLLNGRLEILGYGKNETSRQSYVVNEDEAALVRKIFTTYLECGSLNRTIEKIETLGIKPKVNKNRKNRVVDRGMWTHQSLGDLLKNKSYVGLLEVNRQYKNSDANLLKPHQKYQIVKASWPGIVDAKVFESVQSVLEENKVSERTRLADAEKRVFILSKILKCKECGRPLVGQSSHGVKQVHRYYTHAPARGIVVECKVKRIRANEVEAAVVRHLVQTLHEGGYLNEVARKMVNESKESRTAAQGDRKLLEKRLVSLDEEIASVFDLHLQMENSPQAAKLAAQKLESLGKARETVVLELENHVDQKRSSVSLNDVTEDLKAMTEKIRRGWNKLAPAIQKRLLKRLFKELWCSAEGLEVSYYSNALSQLEIPLGKELMEVSPGAKVFSLDGSKNRPKSLIHNCRTAKVVTSMRVARTTYSLGNRCSICLSYEVIKNGRFGYIEILSKRHPNWRQDRSAAIRIISPRMAGRASQTAASGLAVS